MNFVAARAGEARVWSFFSKWTSIEGFQEEYYDYALGWNLTHRMPWSVPVKEKLQVVNLLTLIYLIEGSYIVYFCFVCTKSCFHIIHIVGVLCYGNDEGP